MARLGSGEKERGGVMQGGVCGDGMGARRTAVVLLASGGGRRPAAQLGVQAMQCVDCAWGVLQGWWDSNERGKKVDSKGSGAKNGGSCCIWDEPFGGWSKVRPRTKQRSLPSWIVARPFIPSVW
jgi:hypothetical protein